MNWLYRRSLLAFVALAGAAASLGTSASAAPLASGSVREPFVALARSFKPTADLDTGAFASPSMSIEVALAPRNEAQLSGLLRALYDPSSMGYRHWLKRGEFIASFAPDRASAGAVSDYLRASGLVIEPSSSPFLVRAAGSSRAVSAALHTSLRTYRNARGIAYYSNASAVQFPARLAGGVYGVVGLSNTVRLRSQIARPASGTASVTPSCETPYVTTTQLFAAVNDGTGFPYGYGGGPGCSGLTPSQDNAIYGAPNLGPRAAGKGVTLGVFELSGYQQSDIQTWARNFYGAGFTAPLVDITVDGGPLAPVCPAGDTCPPSINGYAGDIEVDADLEIQLALSPKADHFLVYNAPNDYSGQTELDEFTKIANDDQADVVSTSWAICENDITSAYAQAENVILEQLAAQGQSVFGAEGDTGAFGCIRSDGSNILNLIDPPAQPWVTSVGGTSFESFNPDARKSPSYPSTGETVWNVDDLCNASAPSPSEGGQSGYFWCGATGAGGGGNSEYWGRPFYQFGRGITNPYTQYGNGGTQCSLAKVGAPCREAPDISADADPYTPYAEYCTAIAGSNSACGFSATEAVPGWFGIGGTSLSSPLWSAIFADRDGFLRHRTGNANPLLYLLYNIDPRGYFHDVTGIGQSTNNNGYYPTVPGYDLATGIGTPKMSAIITGFPQ
jgi:subtilase family serine protease